MEINEELAARISAITAVARTGLAWSPELYERERYERILELSAQMAELLSPPIEASSESLATELREGWLSLVRPGAAGYATPKISTGAFCFDKENRLLLGKRGDSGLWFIPTGWQEVGLTPAQNVVKEVREETGIECRPLKLVMVRDTRLGQRVGSNPRQPNPATIHNIALTFICEALSNEIKVHPLETQEARFFTEREALDIVMEGVRPLIEQGFQYWRGEITNTYFDPLS